MNHRHTNRNDEPSQFEGDRFGGKVMSEEYWAERRAEHERRQAAEADARHNLEVQAQMLRRLGEQRARRNRR